MCVKTPLQAKRDMVNSFKEKINSCPVSLGIFSSEEDSSLLEGNTVLKQSMK